MRRALIVTCLLVAILAATLVELKTRYLLIEDMLPAGVETIADDDLYPLETIESRKRYYAEALPEKWLTMFTHDAKLPWAYVVKDEKGKMVVGA